MSNEQQAPERGWEAHAIAVIKQFYDEWWDNDRRRCLDAIIKRLTPLSSDLATVAQPPEQDTPRLCVKCGHEERHSDNEGGICQKVRIAAQFPDGFDLVCACHCEFAAPLAKPYKEHLREQITNAEEATGYLSACFAEGPDTFALAVRDVWEFSQQRGAELQREVDAKIADGVETKWLEAARSVARADDLVGGKHGVGKSTIFDLKAGKTWKHV